MKQKLALACTLIHTPELLVLDEPTTGVDPVSRRDFWRILARLQREGLTLLLTTPYLDEAERCQRVALMDHGRHPEPEHAGRPARRGAGAPSSRSSPSPSARPWSVLAGRHDVTDVESFGERLHATLRARRPRRSPRRRRVASPTSSRRGGIAVQQVRPIAPSLEDIFIARIRTAQTSSGDEVTP